DVGEYTGIVISVSDGEATSELPAFSITVTAVSANSPPSISGSPDESIEVGFEYTFTPTASDPDGDTLTFSIEGLPAWADFDTATGTLWGTPAAGDENVYSNIVVSVTDGEFTESLASFSIEVVAAASGPSSVTLSWEAPTQNEDGTALTDLAGYNIYWGTTQGDYPNSAPIDNPSVTTITIDGLEPGTYSFVVTAINEAGAESRFSNAAMTVEP
ncbi:MAG: putative Ig domain-containing protein, partial [Woeseiaceae bacterium]|nr:putative Ig domain-containing protein [Woeseiaceae bacterium]